MTSVDQYVDLGTGTGKTAIACIRRLDTQRLYPKVVVVDFLEQVLDNALGKLSRTVDTMPTPSITAVRRDVSTQQPDLREKLHRKGQTHLLTSQRVFINARFDQRTA